MDEFWTKLSQTRLILILFIIVVGMGTTLGCQPKNDQPIYAHQLFTEGLAYESLSNYSRALELYRKVVEDYPDATNSLSARAQLRIARIYKNNLNSSEEAVSAYKKYVDNYSGQSDHQEVLLELARLYENQNNVDRAIDTYQDFYDQYQSSPYREEVMINLGNLHLKRENYSNAINVFNDILQEFPDGESADDALIKRAQAQGESGRPEDQLNTYKTLLNDYPNSEHREYILFQAINVASSLNNEDLVKRWTNTYRDEYPAGEYSSQIEQLKVTNEGAENG